MKTLLNIHVWNAGQGFDLASSRRFPAPGTTAPDLSSDRAEPLELADRMSALPRAGRRPRMVQASCALLALVFAPALVSAQSGGSFSLNWSTLDGGGGTSSGGKYQIAGTIGQSDAGVHTGGNFKLEGGFWSGLTLAQTEGAPILKIKLIGGGMAVLSWPADVTGFTLEETAMITQPNSWNATPHPVTDTATEHTVTVPAVGVIKCYRLKK